MIELGKSRRLCLGWGTKQGSTWAVPTFGAFMGSSENVGRGSQGVPGCQVETEKPGAVGEGRGKKALKSHGTEQEILP